MSAGRGRRTENLLIALLVLSLPLFARRLRGAFQEFPWDFAIFWTAAKGMSHGMSIYGHEDLRALGVGLVGPRMEETFRTTFDSFIELPTTAVFFLPFTRLAFAPARVAFTASVLIAFFLAVFVASRSLPPDDRRLGFILGALFLTTSFSVPASAGVGQVDAFVALALAGSVWAVSRSRLGPAGAFVAVAALVKVSPALVLLHGLLRRKWRMAIAGAVAGIGLLGATLMAVRPGELSSFLRNVVPALSDAPAGMENQSLTAWVARVAGPSAGLANLGSNLGRFAALAPALALLLLAVLGVLTRGRPFEALETSCAVLVGLLAGPVTWTHYSAFAVVFAVTLADRSRWRALAPATHRFGLALSGCGYVFLALPVYLLPHRFDPTRLFSAESVAAHSGLRLLSGVHAIGLLTWFGAGLVLLSAQVRQTASGARLNCPAISVPAAVADATPGLARHGPFLPERRVTEANHRMLGLVCARQRHRQFPLRPPTEPCSNCDKVHPSEALHSNSPAVERAVSDPDRPLGFTRSVCSVP